MINVVEVELYLRILVKLVVEQAKLRKNKDIEVTIPAGVDTEINLEFLVKEKLGLMVDLMVIFI